MKNKLFVYKSGYHITLYTASGVNEKVILLDSESSIQEYLS